MNPRAFLTLALSCLALAAFAQQRPPPVVTNDESGFQLIFDGKSLQGWQGDTNYWRVEDGCLVGEVTTNNLLKQNSFIVWHGGETRDFELKVEYRVSARGNSGINYRSIMVTNGPWTMRGYQADLDGQNRYTGQNYEEKGRTFLAMRGQVTRLQEGKLPQIIGTLGSTNELVSAIHNEDWNEYHLIASGNVLTHILNGRVMSVVIDEDPSERRMDGLLGVQVHVGPPMKIEYRNFRFKPLPETKAK
jgi:3-keto-disaccharide hydrolase